MSSLIRISRAHYPVTVLGPGRRIGIWLQGCSIGCPGCIAKDTWSKEDGKLVDVDALVSWCRQYENRGLEGITISGGEPFEQPEALESLLRELHAWTDMLPQPVDYLCYSGMPFDVLQDRHQSILSLLDVIVPEPFVAELPGKALRGSNNQPVCMLTDLGRTRFTNYAEETRPQQDKRMQLAVENGTVWFIGIPERGDMEKLVELCNAQGLQISNLSWE